MRCFSLLRAFTDQILCEKLSSINNFVPYCLGYIEQHKASLSTSQYFFL